MKDNTKKVIAGAVALAIGAGAGAGADAYVRSQSSIDEPTASNSQDVDANFWRITDLVPEGEVEFDTQKAADLAVALISDRNSAGQQENTLLNAMLIHSLETNGATDFSLYQSPERYYLYSLNANQENQTVILRDNGQWFIKQKEDKTSKEMLTHEYSTSGDTEYYEYSLTDEDGMRLNINTVKNEQEDTGVISVSLHGDYYHDSVSAEEVNDTYDVIYDAYQNDRRIEEILVNPIFDFIPSEVLFDYSTTKDEENEVDLDSSQKFAQMLGEQVDLNDQMSQQIEEDFARVQDDVETNLAKQIVGRANAQGLTLYDSPTSINAADNYLLYGPYYDQIHLQTDWGTRTQIRNETGTSSSYSIELRSSIDYISIHYLPDDNQIVVYENPKLPEFSDGIVKVTDEMKEDIERTIFAPIDQEIAIKDIQSTSYYQQYLADQNREATIDDAPKTR